MFVTNVSTKPHWIQQLLLTKKLIFSTNNTCFIHKHYFLQKYMPCLCRMQNLKTSTLIGIPTSQQNKSNFFYTICEITSIFISSMASIVSNSQRYHIKAFCHITLYWCNKSLFFWNFAIQMIQEKPKKSGIGFRNASLGQNPILQM